MYHITNHLSYNKSFLKKNVSSQIHVSTNLSAKNHMWNKCINWKTIYQNIDQLINYIKINNKYFWTFYLLQPFVVWINLCWRYFPFSTWISFHLKEALVSISAQHNTFKIEFLKTWFQDKDSILPQQLVLVLEIAKYKVSWVWKRRN